MGSSFLEELLAAIRERFPREHEIAVLALINRKQAERIAVLEGDPIQIT